MTKPMRLAMPETAAFVDALRDAFGAAAIDAEIRKGMAGIPGRFHAREAGHEVGTPFTPDADRSVKLCDCVIGPMNLPKKGRNS